MILKFPFCSDCFSDFGLRKTAEAIGSRFNAKCANCGSVRGAKISRSKSENLVVSYFWNGSFFRSEFGGANRLASNPYRYGENEVNFPQWLQADASLIQEKLKIGIFHYGPRLWRLGEIVPLQKLRSEESRDEAAREIVSRFPSVQLTPDYLFHRVRMNLDEKLEMDFGQYDSPPENFLGTNRLDSVGLPVLYGSPDLEICFHECRVTIPDECFIANLKPTRSIRILNFCVDVEDDGPTEFDSVNLALHFLFQAPKHSYPITQAIARAAREAGFEGMLYPSYFSILKNDKVPNLGLFGRPIEENRVEIHSINRGFLKGAKYDYQLGPIFN